MANQIVKLKKGSDYLYPYADFIGIDQSNVLANNVSSYTATQDCFACGYIIDWTLLKIDNVLIVRSAVTNVDAWFPICMPIKKGQTLTSENGGNTIIVYGIKY